MSEPYREGHEYVVCPECKSHFELLPEFWVDAPAGDASFTCDNWECEADCDRDWNPQRRRRHLGHVLALTALASGVSLPSGRRSRG